MGIYFAETSSSTMKGSLSFFQYFGHFGFLIGAIFGGGQLFFEPEKLLADLSSDSVSRIQSEEEEGYSFSFIRWESLPRRMRLLFEVDQNVTVELSMDPKKNFRLFFPHLSLQEVGVSPELNKEFEQYYQGFKEKRMRNLKIQETFDGIEVTGDWVFPEGKNRLADPQMEAIGFHDHGHYLFDFWVKEGPTYQEAVEWNKKQDLLLLVKNMKQVEKTRSLRQKEYEKKFAEIENVTRFCETPLDEAQDVFLEFYAEQEPVRWEKWFPLNRPDASFHYDFVKGTGAEVETAKKAIELYRSNHYSLAIWVVRQFYEQFPGSIWIKEMNFLEANAHLLLGKEEEARKKLKWIYKHFPETKVAVLSAQYLLVQTLKNGAYTPNSFSLLQWLLKNDTSSSLTWVYHLAYAETFYRTGHISESIKEYEWILEHVQSSPVQIDALMRLGNLYLNRMKYEQALATYSRVLTYFKNEKNLPPLFYLNRGEALYQLRKYSEAKDAFSLFLEKFSGHPSGWRAAFRLGEIFARKSQMGEDGKNSRDYFYQTIQRFPHSPGATLARMRLLPCHDHGGFTSQTQKKFYQAEAHPFSKKEDWNQSLVLKNYSDFRALSQIRTLMALEEPREITFAAIEELRQPHGQKVREILNQITKVFFQKLIFQFLNENKKYEALSFFTQKEALIPPPENPFEGEYLIQLSAAAYELGLSKLSREIIQKYEKMNLKDTKKMGENFFKSLPFYLKKSEIGFLKARGLWLSQLCEDLKEFDSSLIEKTLEEISPESSEAFLKEVLLALILEKKKDQKGVFSHLMQAQILCSSLEACVRVENWMAQLQMKWGDQKLALRLFSQIEAKMKGHEKIFSIEKEKKDPEVRKLDELVLVPLTPSLDEVLLAQAEIFERDQNWDEVAAVYRRLFEEGVETDFSRYEYSRALGRMKKKKDLKEFLSVLQKLAALEPNQQGAQGSLFWKKMAQQVIFNHQTEKSVFQSSAKEGKNGNSQR